MVDGFADERFAIVWKTHHAMADGISALDIGMLLFDADRDAPPPPPAEPWRPRPTPSNAALAASRRDRRRRHRSPLRPLARPRRPRSRRRLAPRRRRDRRALGGHLEPRPRPRPKVPINPTRIGADREIAWATFDLAEFKLIKNALGGTVNDVSLAVATGALRAYLAEDEPSAFSNPVGDKGRGLS